jgi:hypothetical protein
MATTAEVRRFRATMAAASGGGVLDGGGVAPICRFVARAFGRRRLVAGAPPSIRGHDAVIPWAAGSPQ